MFIFERLLSKDLEKVYYLIRDDRKKVFKFYTQDKDAISRILSSENTEEAFFEVYTDLYKTVREVLRDDLLEWKTPLYSSCIVFDYQRICVEREKRVREGKRTRILLKD